MRRRGASAPKMNASTNPPTSIAISEVACAALQAKREADKGDLGIGNRVRTASVAQEAPSLPNPAIDFVLSGDAPVHAAIQAEANAFAHEDWEGGDEAQHL